MRNKLIKKTLSIALALSILANISSQTHAADLVAIPQNVRTPILTPAPTQTRSTELSFKSFEAKISNVFKSEKAQPKVTATDDSGSCGGGVTYKFTSEDDKLAISGSGAITDYSSSSAPWSSYRDSIKTVVIENGVTLIGSYAFYHCSGITSVTIPDSVTSIGTNAFDTCTSLINVTIPDSVTSIGSASFKNCSTLSNVSIGNRVTTIGDSAFCCCTNLNSITIGNSVYSIRPGAFKECKKLKSLSLPSSVNTIGTYAFRDCSSLMSIIFPSSVKKIDSGAFKSCSGLTKVTIMNSIIEIGYQAFQYCKGLTSLTLGNKITSIAEEAFDFCLGLSDIIIPDSVKYIGSYAFAHCSGLTSVTYMGTSNPGASSTGIFFDAPVTSVRVPENYSNSIFCGKDIFRDQPATPPPTVTYSQSPTASHSPSQTKGIKDWFIENSVWLAPMFTIASGSVTVISFLFCNDKVKNFCRSHCHCHHKEFENTASGALDENLLFS